MTRDLERRPFEMKRDLGKGFEKIPIKETCINEQRPRKETYEYETRMCLHT